ncbi:MAG TPA: hypothetical protein PKE31_02635 [Pseudomonadota bacterium]|jgi:predicted anti-sigma-YlaC factor YlaD|nr:hypothetical protein [Pseudomonadota bacterium]
MKINPSATVQQVDMWIPLEKIERAQAVAPVESRAQQAESMQRRGRKMVIAGFVITIAGVVAYCAATFAGGMNVDMGDLLFRNADPFALSTLGILGIGTLSWLVGSLTYLRGAMDADEESSQDAK